MSNILVSIDLSNPETMPAAGKPIIFWLNSKPIGHYGYLEFLNGKLQWFDADTGEYFIAQNKEQWSDCQYDLPPAPSLKDKGKPAVGKPYTPLRQDVQDKLL